MRRAIIYVNLVIIFSFIAMFSFRNALAYGDNDISKLNVSDICVDNGNSIEEASCLSPYLDRAQKEMSILTDSINKKIDENTRSKLQDSQKQWQSDMMSTCDVLVTTYYGGGNLRYSKPVRCELRMTVNRISIIKEIFKSTLNN